MSLFHDAAQYSDALPRILEKHLGTRRTCGIAISPPDKYVMFWKHVFGL
jgi:hypothetical protein